MPIPDASAVPFPLVDGWPQALMDCRVTLRETGILLGSLSFEDDEWHSLKDRQVHSIRIDDHPLTDGWTTRHPDGSEESTEFTIPTTPVSVPRDALRDTRAFEEWVIDVHGGSGRLLVWDETLTWWCAQDPGLEAMFTSAPVGRFSPYSDELSWLSFGTDAGRETIQEACARYGLEVPTYSDFVSQAHLFVQEQGQLFDLPAGARELMPQGWVQHGPWRPEWCAEILLAWLENELVAVFADDGIKTMSDAPAAWFERATISRNGSTTFYDLAPEHAHEVLASPDLWRIGTARGLLMCSPTDKGEQTSFKEWARLLSDYRE